MDIKAETRLGLQHSVDEALAGSGDDISDGGREEHPPGQLPLQRLLDVGVVERHAAGHHDKQDAAQAPHVVHAWPIRLASQQLRGGVGGAAAEGLAQLVVLLQGAREAEVGQHDAAVTADEHVLALEVPVTQSPVVEVAHAFADLRHKGRQFFPPFSPVSPPPPFSIE